MLEVEDKNIRSKIKNWKVNILNPKNRGIGGSGKKSRGHQNSASQVQDE